MREGKQVMSDEAIFIVGVVVGLIIGSTIMYAAMLVR
jgi:hypothetical protein